MRAPGRIVPPSSLRCRGPVDVVAQLLIDAAVWVDKACGVLPGIVASGIAGPLDKEINATGPCFLPLMLDDGLDLVLFFLVFFCFGLILFQSCFSYSRDGSGSVLGGPSRGGGTSFK